MAEVRTRIAPSPTGSPHVGTLFMGLFNRAFAKAHGGSFLLRIEDTDQTRSRPAYEQQILESLRWSGLEWDEGPDVGGDFGPYRQSERSEIYSKYALELIDKDWAYRAFDTPEEIEAQRKEARAAGRDTRYDGGHRDLSSEEVKQRMGEGQPFVVRFKMPREGKVVVQDLLRGEVEFDPALIDDQILLKSDGLPTYHLANVVDDHLMKITHVIRGEEWLNSAPKHVLLYQAFGWEAPTWVHMPLLLNPDGSKLSKRKNPTSILYYREAGFLPEALSNYLCQMGYHHPGEDEKFSLKEFQEDLDLTKVSLGGSVFDRVKLRKLNARYIREDLSEEQVFERLRNWRFSDKYLRSLIPMMHQRMETLGDFIPRTHSFFRREVELSAEDLASKKHELAELPEAHQVLMWALDEQEDWTPEGIEGAIRKVAAFLDWKLREVTALGYRSVLGEPVGPPLYESFQLLGRDLVRDRFQKSQEVAGGLSKKKASKLEKRWRVFVVPVEE
jgi:glutamyl-tRNA synthetase